MFDLFDVYNSFVVLRRTENDDEVFGVNYAARKRFYKLYGIEISQIDYDLFTVNRLNFESVKIYNFADKVYQEICQLTDYRFTVEKSHFYTLYKKFGNFHFWSQCMQIYYLYPEKYRWGLYWDISYNNPNICIHRNKLFAYDVIQYFISS